MNPQLISIEFRNAIIKIAYSVQRLESSTIVGTSEALFEIMAQNFTTDFSQSRKEDQESVQEMVKEFPKESDRPSLHDAVYKCQIGIVQTLLSTPGTDINGLGFLSHGTSDTFMMEVTPLFLAIQLLPDIKIRPNPQSRPSEHAIKQSEVQDLIRENYDLLLTLKKTILSLLLAHGADYRQRCRGLTTLHWAALKGAEVAMDILLGLDPELLTTLDYHLALPLHCAIEHGNHEAAKYLVEQMIKHGKRGALNTVNNRNETPLDLVHKTYSYHLGQPYLFDIAGFEVVGKLLEEHGGLANRLYMVYEIDANNRKYIQYDHTVRMARYGSMESYSFVHDGIISPAWMWEVRHSIDSSGHTAMNKYMVLAGVSEYWSAGINITSVPKGPYHVLINLGLCSGSFKNERFGIMVSVVDIGIRNIPSGFRNIGPAKDLFSATFWSTDVLQENGLRLLDCGEVEVEDMATLMIKVSPCADPEMESRSWNSFVDPKVICPRWN
jgi:hypothetical protein